MKLIVGLGNPGKKYEKTRHNVGFLILEKLKTEMTKSQITNNKQIPNSKFQFSKNANALYVSFGTGDQKVELIKPQTFMNKSGFSVAYARNKYKVPNNNVYVIHDDLDIKLGEYKIQKGKGPRDHNGLLSIYEKLGTRDFWHVRVGIDNRQQGLRISGEDYVLQRFTNDETEIVDGVVEKIAKDLIEILQNG